MVLPFSSPSMGAVYRVETELVGDLGHQVGSRPEPGIPEKDVIGYDHGTA